MLEKVENKLTPYSIPRDLKSALTCPPGVNDNTSLLLVKSALICYNRNGKKKGTPCSSLCKISKMKISRAGGVLFPRGACFSARANEYLKLWFQTGSPHSPFLPGLSWTSQPCSEQSLESEKCGPERSVSRYRFRIDQGGRVKLYTREHAESPRISP